MSISEVPLRFRVHPGVPAKAVTKPRKDWPVCTAIYHSRLGADGEVTLGVLFELVNDRPVKESLVFIGREPPAKVIEYVSNHLAAVTFGAPSRLGLLSTDTTRGLTGTCDGIGYRLRDRGYRKGWAVAGADLHRQLIGLAPSFAHARRIGAWSVPIPGLGKWVVNPQGDQRFTPHSDAPRLIMTPIGRAVLIRWGGTRPEPKPGDETECSVRHRPAPKRGPFVDVLVLARALSGRDDICELTDACVAFGVDPPLEIPDHSGQLRAEGAAIARLYRAELTCLQRMQLHLDPSTLMSTGGVAAALLREAGVRP